MLLYFMHIDIYYFQQNQYQLLTHHLIKHDLFIYTYKTTNELKYIAECNEVRPRPTASGIA
jgi:hypothetical protein